jgi:hypothetical protein
VQNAENSVGNIMIDVTSHHKPVVFIYKVNDRIDQTLIFLLQGLWQLTVSQIDQRSARHQLPYVFGQVVVDDTRDELGLDGRIVLGEEGVQLLGAEAVQHVLQVVHFVVGREGRVLNLEGVRQLGKVLPIDIVECAEVD